ncbi:phosphoglycolate phosphatase [Thermotomaculum hydrothermale]|uniref:phosphoglycolate phosphatase n=1 Tax=Thermotomaculum hydrothermale TaxID=981385 RepID=A0A7R6PE97_9BACT|nr:HAD-IA family hydrolase [Thermotomaculum hydrothermale]BBB32103.1 phosphoglycolate phosphatase [Thermotomaculum hydrothermale]
MKELNKLAIFDLDGTLVDSLDDLVLSANETRKLYKLPPLSKDTISSFVGDGLVLFVERLFQDSKVDIEDAISNFKKKYFIHLTDNTRFYEGTIECIKKLKDANFVVGILSNKTERLSKLVVEQLGQKELFDFIYGGDSFPEKKPSPLPILKILKKFNGDKESSFMIGDSCNDILSGQKAGIKTIAVTYGFNGVKHLKKCTADFVAHNPEKICNLILNKE